MPVLTLSKPPPPLSPSPAHHRRLPLSSASPFPLSARAHSARIAAAGASGKPVGEAVGDGLREAIVRKFTEAGYGAAVPEVVFWNLRDSMAMPVTSGQKGVALVSGFSKNLPKLFFDSGGNLTPGAVMEKVIAGPEYDKLLVFD